MLAACVGVALAFTGPAIPPELRPRRQPVQFSPALPSAKLPMPAAQVLKVRGGAFPIMMADQIFGVPTLMPSIILSGAFCLWFTGVLGQTAGWYGLKLVYAGAVAGIISRSCCAPLEMVSTLMMCRGDECQSMSEELKSTFEKEGAQGLFKGNGANCMKVAPQRGVQFLVYEYMKRLLVTMGWFGIVSGVPLNAGARLFAGGIAGMAAAVIVYPLEVVKTLRTVYPDECSGLRESFECALRYGGVRNLYRGIMPTLVAMFPYVGVEFMVYETFKRRWETFIGAKAGVVALLVLGALGGAAAQASAHPLDVVRRRMQMSFLQERDGEKSDAAQKKGKPPITNMFSGLYRIAKDEGPHILFRGLGPACLEKVPSTAIGYYIYEGMKAAMKVTSV